MRVFDCDAGPGNVAFRHVRVRDSGATGRSRGTRRLEGSQLSYDYAQRLTQAWTPASSSCGVAPSGSTTLGGPAPYWQSYTYDAAGDRASITRHKSPNLAADVTATYAYPAADRG